MTKYNQKAQATLLLLTMSLACSGCAAREPELIQHVDTAMGTIISQSIYTAGAGTTVTEDIMAELARLEEKLLSRRLDTSEIYRLNQSAGEEEGRKLSQDMLGYLEQCLKVSEASEGTFDITIGDVVRLWDIDAWTLADSSEGYMLPAGQQIKEALSHTGYDRLGLEGDRLLLPEGMSLDMGAVGKGIALDNIRDYLNNLQGEQKVTAAIISVGGSVLTYGGKPDGTSWNVGIVNPHNTAQNLGYLSLTGEWCVSTSGDYERYVEVDGKRYHHIIDPRTGYPAANGVSSVTIVSRSGLESDALSTACFILGVEQGLKLAEALDGEAVIVDTQGGIHMTEGIKDLFVNQNERGLE